MEKLTRVGRQVVNKKGEVIAKPERKKDAKKFVIRHNKGGNHPPENSYR